ncbi:hypothetical protein V8E54_009262 [Elaphomyces granulatus]
MDPVSLTASVIAFATLATQSCKATYDLIDGLKGAPQVIANSKTLLSETQKTLDTLEQTLTTGPEMSSTLASALRMIELDSTLKSTKSLCDEFRMTITKFTSHSTESKIVSSHTSEDIKRLSDSFRDQEQALVNLGTELRNSQTSLSNQLAVELQKLCQGALSATKEKRTATFMTVEHFKTGLRSPLDEHRQQQERYDQRVSISRKTLPTGPRHLQVLDEYSEKFERDLYDIATKIRQVSSKHMEDSSTYSPCYRFGTSSSCSRERPKPPYLRHSVIPTSNKSNLMLSRDMQYPTSTITP